MTLVLGHADGETTTLGADSAMSMEGEVYTMDVRKVFQRGPFLFGVCGSYRVTQILRFQAELPEPPPAAELEPFLVTELAPAIRRAIEEEGVAGSGCAILGEKTALILGCRGRLWFIGNDLTVVPASPFAAIGSGRHRAYGALHALREAGVEPPRRMLELALAAAAKTTPTVRPPWHFVSMGPSDSGELAAPDKAAGSPARRA